MNNARIAEVFTNIARLLEIKGEPAFTILAYQRAAWTIEDLPTELAQIIREGGDLREIPGIGKAISEKIKELVSTGRLSYFENLKSELPEGILDVIQVPGIGPKTARLMWEQLGISTVRQLREALADGRVAALPRMGEKKAENILREVRSKRVKEGRVPIAGALPHNGPG